MAEVVNGVRTAVRDLLSGIAGALVAGPSSSPARSAPRRRWWSPRRPARSPRWCASPVQLMKALGKALSDAVTWLVVLRDLFDGLIRAANQLEANG
ncbi:hypothetical protein AB0I53_21100 [Saccharopolyspora sp. NPDC050389]|uniref:hypothetical protein n=1 Tax=Saccharopolyspora sp. NPDC050389 TaxID=3155516 RepID=UPI0033CD7892